MDSSTLSIVMPNYNHGRYIGEALEAILSQSFIPLEVIVVDDGSTDNSVEVVQRIAVQNSAVRLVRNTHNMGISASINRGLESASGDYVHFPAADDKVLPGFFEKSMDLLRDHPYAAVCTSLVRLIDNAGNDLGVPADPRISTCACYLSPQEVRAVMENTGPFVVGNTLIYKKSALLELGGYAPYLMGYWDSFTGHALASKYGACYIPEALTCWRQLDSSYSKSLRGNIRHNHDVIRQVTHLMRYSMPELFPAKFVDRLERRETYLVGMTAYQGLLEQHDRFLTDLDMVFAMRRPLLARGFLWGLRVWLRIAGGMIRRYLQFNYRISTELIIRKLRRRLRLH